MTVATAKSKTALADKLGAEGARMREYAGALTAAEFGDVGKEFCAITESCGMYDLGWRAKIAVLGEDRARWLNGMVTNNVKDLALNHGNYNFLLNAQGRIQGDLYAYNRGDKLLLDTERSQVEHLTKTFEHFIIMDDVELSDQSDAVTSIGVQGPRAEEALKRCGIHPQCADPLVLCDTEWAGKKISVTRMASDDYLTYEIWLSPQDAPALWDALKAAGADPAGTDALEQFRVMAGIPKYGTDIGDRVLPQETGQDHALNFTKGCYIGQEIVERIRSRGNLHRMFIGFVLEGGVPAGSKVADATGKEVGELTSVQRVPFKQEERWLALGYIRREALNSSLTAGNVPVKTSKVPFKS